MTLRRLLSYGFFAFVFAFTLCTAIGKYKPQHYKIAVWDTEGYYIYLPAVFIYHGFEGIPSQTIVAETQQPYLQKWPGTEKVYTKYTCGEAIMILPFWLVAHGIAHAMPARYAPDGFSEIYMLLFLIAIATYLTAGLYILWRVLRRYFSDAVVFLSLACIWMGTSFVQYTSFNPGNSHVFSYFLIALLVYQTPALYRHLSAGRVVSFALNFGLIALLRPTNAVVLLYPVLYDVRSVADLKARVAYFYSYIRYLPVFIIVTLSVFIPQFVYWKYATGHWALFSYVGEGFFYWKRPHIAEVLFSHQNGLFIYAPLLLLAVPGMLIGWRDRRLNIHLCLVILALATYTFGSWSCWWYGASYGHRAFIDFLLFFAMPLCVLFQWLVARGKVATLALITVVALGLFFSYRLNSIYEYPWEGNNWHWSDVKAKYKEAVTYKRA